MAPMEIGCFIVGMVQTNFYYLHREGSEETIVFDPGDYGNEIYKALTEKGLVVKAIFLTHAHFDHIYGVAALKEKTGAPVYANILEKDVCTDPQLNHSAMHGMSCTVNPDHYLHDGETVSIAGIDVKMISTPGHTEGSCCYYMAEDHILMSGDTLFEESVGRTDLPTGSMADLVDSIKNKLFLLPDDTQVYTGHGGFTSIGHEKKHNYYV